MPAGEKKYLLVAKRRLTFTSSSVAVSVCCPSIIDDRWYNVPRRPLTGLTMVAVFPPLLLSVAAADDAIFAAADILKWFIGKDRETRRFCLAVLAIRIYLRSNFIQTSIYDHLVSDGPIQAIHFDLRLYIYIYIYIYIYRV